MTEYYSAINVPTDTANLVALINDDINYYVGPKGLSTNDGLSVNNAFDSLGSAFAAVKNKRIAKGFKVYINILDEPGMTGWNQHTISDSMVEVSHPNADRIFIRGKSAPEEFSPYGINYYDSTLRGMGDAVTGGYLMEIICPNNSLNNMDVGDFITITDENYTSTTRNLISNTKGPAFLETDFLAYESGLSAGFDLSGNSYDASPLSLRKTLMLGCHEVVGVDRDNGTSIDSQCLLVHVRHNNPTASNVVTGNGGGGLGGTTAGTAYITPQSLRWASSSTHFSDNAIAGKIIGTDYRFVYDGGTGITQSRLFNKPLPLASGFTSGATGNYGFTGPLPDVASSSGFGNTRHTQIGGISGANGYWWDASPHNAGTSGPYGGIKIKRIPYRIHFDSSSGLKITGTPLGGISDVVFCGPGFALGATTAIAPDGTKGVWCDYNGGLLSTSNFAVVGFGDGIRADNNSTINANGSVVSNCRQGYIAEHNAHLGASHTIASGCYIGYFAQNQSHINADYSISVANENDGFFAANNSSLSAHASLSCLNSGYGFAAVDTSSIRLTLQSSVRGDASSTQRTGSTADARYGLSDKSGAFGFRNSKAGVYSESSTVYGDNSRMSYNAESGYYLNEGSYANINYSNSYYNGFGSNSGASNETKQSGISAVNASKMKAIF